VLDQGTLTRLRATLTNQRDDLRRELLEHGAAPDSDELAFDDDAGFADRSHSTEERARLIAVVRALRSNLQDVERALIKMDAGGYGTCERCGKEIPAERLEAIPWALLCVDCKKLAGA
jgi:DnaK suppressor protein